MSTIGDEARLGTAEQFPVITSIIEAARAKLSPELWDIASGGAESETTLRRNRAGFDQIAFRPRLLRDVHSRSTASTFLGQELNLPVMFAPVGSLGKYHPDGALAVARVAERAGSATFVSALTPGWEEVRAKTRGPMVLQFFTLGNRDWIENLVRRAEHVGAVGLCLTVDTAARGHRERDLRNNRAASPYDIGERYQETFTWADFDWLRSITKLPLILKGLMCAEDARLAVEHRADVVHVSNHGGRQLDHLPSTIEVLPEIIAAVNGRAVVIIDGGFIRGSDVLKALALGASAVLIGKLMVWALAAGGEAGLEHALELLRREISDLLAHLGVRSLRELNAEYVRPVAPPPDGTWIGFQTSGKPWSPRPNDVRS
jgi:glycolate oxidase